VEILTKQQLEDAANCKNKKPCEQGLIFDCNKCAAMYARTALHYMGKAEKYRDMLKRLMFVVEGFDYRTNIKFSISDLIGIEKEVKILLKSGG
jgi:hypothetical protein